MPVIKVWCLPKSSEAELNALHKSLVAAALQVDELGLKDENDFTMLFPRDMMAYGLGQEIIVEVTGLFIKPERDDLVRERLATYLGLAVKERFPKAMVECFINPFALSQGFWTSRGYGDMRFSDVRLLTMARLNEKKPERNEHV